jgi:hypothetical protein
MQHSNSANSAYCCAAARLVADGMPIELGTRAFDLLLVLLDADGSLVTKGELLSRAWPGIVVAEDNFESSDLRIAQGSWRRPRFYPYRIRPRLSVYWHSSLGEHLACESALDATPEPASVGSPMDFSAIIARLMCPGVNPRLRGIDTEFVSQRPIALDHPLARS